MGKGLRAFCVYCDKEVRQGDPFCRRCRRPTSWASNEQRAAWELEEWKNGRRPTLVPLASKDTTETTSEAEGSIVPMPARPPEVAEETYTPPAEYYQRAAGDDSVAPSSESPMIRTSVPAAPVPAAAVPAAPAQVPREPAERVLTTASMSAASLEPVSNGNGVSNGDGPSNGHAVSNGDGAANGHAVSNGNGAVSAHAVSNGDGVSNGNGVSNSSKVQAAEAAAPEPSMPAPIVAPAEPKSVDEDAPLAMSATLPAAIAPQAPAVSAPSNGANGAHGSPSSSNGSPMASNGSNGSPSGSNGSPNGSNGPNGSTVPASNGGSKQSTAKAPVLHPRTPGPTYPLVVGTREIAVPSVEEKLAPMPAQTQPDSSERIAELVAEVRTLRERVAGLEGRLKAVAAAKRPHVEAVKAEAVEPAPMSAEEAAEAAARVKALTAYAMGAQPIAAEVESNGGFLASLKRVLTGIIEVRD